MAEVCVDASLALKLVLAEANSDVVRAQWGSWVADGIEIVAPWLWLFESHAVLRRKVARRELTEVRAREAWRLLRRQGVRTVHPRGLFDRAWTLATELDRPTTYDGVYLAVADLRGCELWTADRRLHRAAGPRYAWVRAI